MAIVSVGGYDGTAITEPQFGAAISDWAFEYGVVGAGDWKVSAHPSTPGAVNIAAGQGWGHGVMETSDSIVTVTQTSLPSSGSRWDMVVMHRDWQPPGGASTFQIITGTSAKQLAIRDANPGVEDDQPLALVQWTAGQTQPTAIVDLRVWASNGGVVAKDELVLTYLTRLGSSITIGDGLWQRILGANDVVQWTKLTAFGRIPVFGYGWALDGPNYDTSLGGFLVQAGTTVQRFDQSGYARIIWPKPFPNGLLYCDVSNGDEAALANAFFAPSGRFDVWGSEGIGNKASVVYSGIGQLPDQWISRTAVANRLHRANWIAIGY